MQARVIGSEQSMAVQRVMDSNAEYSRHVSGTRPTADAALEVLTARPPGVSTSQKADLGLWDDDSLVAFADVIVGWPSASVAHIGLLMTDGARQGEGLGRRMHDAVVDWVRGATEVEVLRLSIVDANADVAEPFWAKLGYQPTGEVSPYVSGRVESTARVWVRPVVAA